MSLQQRLEIQPDFALREGETAVHGWSVGSKALRALTKTPRALVAQDLVPNIEQKGVDLRIGLDIARLSLRGLVDVIVVVTGDSDMVPAFKFARREGVRVYLDHMGHGIKRDLKAHADRALKNLVQPPLFFRETCYIADSSPPCCRPRRAGWPSQHQQVRPEGR